MALGAEAIDVIATSLDAAAEAARTQPLVTATHPGFGLDDAYRVSAAVHARRLARGWRPLGRKIGFTNRSIWPLYGVDAPMWAYVYDRTVTSAPAARVELPLAATCQPRIEPEICFRLAGPVPTDTDDPQRILGACEAFCHSIEVVQTHFDGWKFTLVDAAADSALHGLLAVGPWHPIAAADRARVAEALGSARVSLRKEGVEQLSGVGANALGHPALALAFLARTLADQRGSAPLRAGEIVSTGTLTDALPVAPGETWSTIWEGIEADGFTVRFV